MLHDRIATHIRVIEGLADSAATIDEMASRISESLESGGRLLICGNGGSAADAQHLAAELVGRFRHERVALPAMALAADIATLTAIGNDYGYADIFARQVAAHGRPGDCLLLISTSGNSENCLRAASEGRYGGLVTLAMTGASGGRLADIVDICLHVQSSDTARVQEAHGFIIHLLAEHIERRVMVGAEIF